MTTPRCLLFDCDGTLVDSEPLLAAEMAASLNTLGLPFTANDYITEFRGARFKNIIHELQQRHGSIDPDRLQHTESEMRSNLAQRMATELTPLPGVIEALDSLSDYPRAVVSNGPETKIRNGLEATGLSHYFGDRLFSGYTANCWKPDPCLFLYAARMMGFDPEECIAIDDSIVGVEAALAAGMIVIHLNRYPDAEETPDGAIPISNMHQLPTIVTHLVRTEAVTT
ncbi:HAD family hydrolase [Aidingimonas halophila]|uniref:Haloacid dehalogenase superfamily, subfamily IA, variant 3 with third motif having DD or ED n=1 Tax=Aidingimonas halophila TaxID=574349 RepID=A0A1H3FRC5_9GAMM|nr:HAD-IA family hydrolase [Aidingimonas halophila]GHC38263.1 6-phosphogluconate phosphatase [Aidingimonas halophila]SDX92938.1 haloacid dehalogenase superfamily, subfamily IA, variant 3 with third motif having DD or ED [Aidingimonas halophila]